MLKFKGLWEPNNQRYLDSCIRGIENLHNFKRDSIYRTIVGNDMRDKKTAEKFFFYLKNNSPEVFAKLDKFTSNDSLGGPNIYQIDNVSISPGTLRYIKVLSDIVDIEPKSIVEIGSGYGGQAYITSLFFEDIEYSMIDLTEPLLLCKKYLETISPDKSYNYINSNNIIIKSEYDLVISDYCLSEFDQNGMNFYLNEVVKKSKNGYFSVNSKPKMKKYLIEQLKLIFETVEIYDEDPKTTHHPNIMIKCKNNKLL